MDKLMLELANIKDESSDKELSKKVNRLYRLLPNDDDQVIDTCNNLMKDYKWKTFYFVITWIKKRQLYKLKYFTIYERWLYKYVNSWGSCDVFCYRVLNPMIEKYPKLYNKLLKWARSRKVYVRRAAAVAMIQSTNNVVIVDNKKIIYGFKVTQDFNKISEICDILKDDRHIHVQKGIGWLLKYAYITYPDEVIKYLKANVHNLSRTTFRYALEKMPAVLKKELMEL
ncbi:MAG: DNA alkylation repair protein [Bacilli bacterium]|jgi:3-methyladenine DNA glycosylase AlkD